MNISVQSSTAALIALENLTHSNAEAAARAGSANQTPDAAGQPAADQPASIWDLSGAPAAGAPITDLSNATSIADAAVSAGGAVADLLAQMRQAAASASDPGLGADARSALDTTFKADLAQIGKTVGQASVNGVNLIDGSLSGAVQQPAGGGDTITFTAANLSLGGPLIGLSASAGLTDPQGSADIAAGLATAIDAVTQAVGKIAAQGQAAQSHLDLVTQAALASATGQSGAAGGALDQDGARLQALQVQQQLMAGGYAVSNQAPQAILALFR